ncbi:MAG: ABC transporter ATP-binding protein [Nostocales cyanobacterium 94392]|nr:ABC transporter ATP-binding protein [Nostocales cyanobacterium 94392]
MQKYLLEFEQVHYTYPGAQESSLNGVTLNIPSGKKSALIGQNGCGKTTLFLLANGLYKPSSGIVRWHGKPLRYDRKYLSSLRQEVGLIFQDPEQQIVASTIEEDISYGLCNLNLPDQEIQARVEEILTQLQLQELAQRPVHHLSLGQKKRVSIADVMILRPKLLLLDEPTAYLDIKHTRQLIKILNKIHQDGTTLLMSTHDLDLVYRWADWIFVMDKGRLIIEGEPEDIFAQGELLEQLQLGLPLIYQLLFDDSLSAEEKAVLEKIRQRILKM